MRRGLHRIFGRNLWLKVFALLAAIAIWWAVTHEPATEISYTAPIEFRHLPENMEITSEQIPEAHIRARGPAQLVREVEAGRLHPVVDFATLGPITPGEHTYDLNASEMAVPRYVDVQIVPAQFRLSFDVRTTRMVPVQPRVVGTFAAGLQLAEVRAEPGQVMIVGPRDRVNAVTTALTDPIDASGVVKEQTFSTHAYIADPLVRVAQPDVRVTVRVERKVAP
jgi:YbbR domain-containing protein